MSEHPGSRALSIHVRRVLLAAAVLLGAGGASAAMGAGVAMAAGAAQPTGVVRTPRAEAAGRLELRTDRAVIFKDGHALIVKTATGTADGEGRVFTEEVPESAVLGSFWAASVGGDAAAGRPIRAMRAEWAQEHEDRTRLTACATTVELLRANVGREVTILMNWGADAAYSGVLDAVLDQPPQELEPLPWPPAPAPPGQPWEARPEADHPATVVRELVPQGGQFVSLQLLDAQGGRVVLPTAEVRSVSGAGLLTSISRHERVTTRGKRLTFDLDAAAAGEPVTLRVMYFTPGLRWIPTYRVSGELATSADLELQAELLNELEDLEGAEIDLVVGVPNFRFKGVVSPLSLEATMRNALLRAAPQVMGAQSQVSNAYFGNRAGEWRGGGGGDAAEIAPELGQEVGAGGAAGEQDLYVYSLGKMSLAKGSRAGVPLWKASAPLKHLYTMELQIVRNQRGGGRDYAAYDRRGFEGIGEGAPGGGASPLRLAEHQVWHQLELLNTTKGPWTTGPALIMRGTLPLGQELMTYTPPKACALVPVTVAVDVRGNYTEEEIERTPNALRWESSGHTFTLVRKRATVTLVNYRSEKTQTRVTLATGGRVEKASDEGEIVVNDYQSQDWGDQSHDTRPSNHSDVTWAVELAPGETKSLTVEFFYYMR